LTQNGLQILATPNEKLNDFVLVNNFTFGFTAWLVMFKH